MTARVLRWSVLLLPVSLVLGLAPGLAARATQGASEKSILVTVLDASGKPVKDLTAADFAIREDNVMREVTGAKLATEPLFISLISDTSKPPVMRSIPVQDMRTGLTSFVHDVLAASPESQIALGEFGGAAQTQVNFTNVAANLEKGITKQFPKDRTGSVMLEALIDSSKTLAKKASMRKAIVSLNLGPAPESSQVTLKVVGDEFQKGGASLWAVTIEQGINPNREQALNVLTTNSGGLRLNTLSSSTVEAMLKSIADDLTSQYVVTFRRPDSSTPTVMTQVGMNRQGVKPLARIWAPK